MRGEGLWGGVKERGGVGMERWGDVGASLGHGDVGVWGYGVSGVWGRRAWGRWDGGGGMWG